ncbi:GNAT family N-acetyltransferase [Intrasporangium sp.]|uniref:GNAT family N-acetyltransferase n=1 Tax=Intrasporangium sp. TaxID=1925024 RepID=UPI00293A5FB8|nr:GNAT family N-acetyltransferase [Intrasporangium sp.]MDV3220345.1 GNAT family N-acetyltransferase [Intrasporangium sp.]
MTDSLEIRPLDLLDESQAEHASAWVEVHAAVQRELFGDGGSEWTLDELRAMHRKTDKKRVALAAWSGGHLVGALSIMLPMLDNHSLAMFFPAVLAEHRRRGVGSRLVETAEGIAREHGRSTFLAETEWPEGGVDLGAEFARRHGYVVAQEVLRSEMHLPAPREGLQRVVAEEGAEDYVVECFVDDLPEAWLEDRAHLQRRMSTDAPLDDVEWQEEVWDAGRMRAAHASARSTGRRVVEAVARHVPSGRLVGFTRVEVSPARLDLGYQQDTLVLREHRGHGLGLRLKAAAALLLMDALPEVRAVRTWNAASNRHMLAVNRALGYRVDGYSREWQKHLD